MRSSVCRSVVNQVSIILKINLSLENIIKPPFIDLHFPNYMELPSVITQSQQRFIQTVHTTQYHLCIILLIILSQENEFRRTSQTRTINNDHMRCMSHRENDMKKKLQKIKMWCKNISFTNNEVDCVGRPFCLCGKCKRTGNRTSCLPHSCTRTPTLTVSNSTKKRKFRIARLY